ncbi:MAG: hypothetical protein MPK62_00290 [Alphaproteobacteria bacterium]|nr:hypothetical protein [Alphaproteobacteria bacterium]MDA8029576.1 hypothetical protein [Alphaproteobacteria bacterium]
MSRGSGNKRCRHPNLLIPALERQEENEYIDKIEKIMRNTAMAPGDEAWTNTLGDLIREIDVKLRERNNEEIPSKYPDHHKCAKEIISAYHRVQEIFDKALKQHEKAVQKLPKYAHNSFKIQNFTIKVTKKGLNGKLNVVLRKFHDDTKTFIKHVIMEHVVAYHEGGEK